MGGGWRCVAACKQQTHVLSWARWPTRSESAAGWAPVCHEASVTGGAGGEGLAQCLCGHLAALGVQASARMGTRARRLPPPARKGDRTRKCKLDPDRST